MKIVKNIHQILLMLFLIFFTNNLFAEILKKIEISGNTRISNETIKVYGEIKLNQNYSNEDINSVIKKLYETKFFSRVSTSFTNGILKIQVEENPVINTIVIEGEVAKKFKTAILKVLSLKEKGSYIESDVANDIEIIKNYYTLA